MKKDFEVHHIDLDQSNNVQGNLFRTDKHLDLHNQLRFLFDAWQLDRMNFPQYSLFIRVLIQSGELVFERDIPRYRFNPIEGGLLWEYEKSLNSVDIYPIYVTPSLDAVKLQRKIKVVRDAREKLKDILMADVIRRIKEKAVI